MSATDHPASASVPQRRAQHKWFPIAVLVAAAAWWIRQATVSEYQTLFHVLVVLACIILTTGWYLFHGAQPRHVRRWLVLPVWCAIVALFILFKPVYNGDMGFYSMRLRFAPRADQLMHDLSASGKTTDWQTTPRDYPRFLGMGHWAEVGGVELETDWRTTPPQEVWRREIGAGWSAFAIVGNYAITQEQRGPHELVTCYRLQTGEPVWTHRDEARFDPADALGGLGDIGPRATPTIHDDKVFTQGGTGIVNCLDARSGERIWSHDTVDEFGATLTLWGKSGSPLIVDDLVVVSVGAPTGPDAEGDKNYRCSLVAFDIDSGEVRWTAGSRQASYASPIIANIAGERQIVVVNESYVTAHRPDDGEVLWEHPWAHENDREASCPQPIPLGEDRLLLTKGYGVGASLLKLERRPDGGLTVKTVWDPPIKRVMKNKFSNPVIRDAHVYGLDDVMLACVELDTGKVKWKKRRNPEFGHGQILLIGGVILVLSETGELALVEVSQDEYRELAAMQVLDDANVTWNNPAFSSPYLLVRNAHEAACYRLPLK
jgi:outer membrane protein assembly factor BamB